MDREEWLLLFLYIEPKPRPNYRIWPMDPVRIQKGLFLLTKQGPAGASELYDFVPYNYGPCSFELYSDLDRLEFDGLIESQVPPGHTWKQYSVTVAGSAKGEWLSEHLPAADRVKVEAIKSFVATRSFRQLLKDVYVQFPDYTSKSVMSSL